MLLDRIEIDTHGPLSRVELGPFSHHLNVILGASGSGKTAISRFVRDSLIDRQYPHGMLSGSTGRVVWVTSGGRIHCRREQDASRGGRRHVEFEARSESPIAGDAYADGWFDPRQEIHHHSVPTNAAGYGHPESLAARTFQNVRIPESIVDGVMIDTTISSVSRVVAACLSAGLDNDRFAARSTPYENETSRAAMHAGGFDSAEFTSHATNDRDELGRRRRLREELADIDAQISLLQTQSTHTDYSANPASIAEVDRRRQECLRHRQELISHREIILQNMMRALHSADVRRDEVRLQALRADENRLRQLHAHADSLRDRAAGLQRWISQLDHHSQWDVLPTSLTGTVLPSVNTNASTYSATNRWTSVGVDQLQSQLAMADQELIDLRRILGELQGLRGLMQQPSSLGSMSPDNGNLHNWNLGSYGHRWLDEQWLLGKRYDHFVHAIDRYRTDRPWQNFYQDAYQPLHQIDDVAMRIQACGHQIDRLIQRLSATPSGYGTTNWHTPSLSMNSLVHSLQQIRQQLGQANYLTTSHLDHVTGQLTAAVEQLMAERARMIDTLVATRHETSRVAQRQIDWANQRRVATTELQAVEAELRSVLSETASLRRADRHLPIIDPVYDVGMFSNYPGAPTRISETTGQWERDQTELASIDQRLANLADELRQINLQVSDWHLYRDTVSAPRMRGNLGELQSRRVAIIEQLNRHRPIRRRESSLAESASRWLVRLSGGRYRKLSWSLSTQHVDALAGNIASAAYPDQRTITTGQQVEVRIDDHSERDYPAACRAIACVAVRMAAGEQLTLSGNGIPLMIETQPELFSQFAGSSRSTDAMNTTSADAYRHWTAEGVHSDVVSSAFSDYAAGGNQLVVLTQSTGLAEQLHRSGGRMFRLQQERIVHAHQPLWRDRHPRDQFVGNVSGDYSLQGANRLFEQAWRESAGIEDGDARASQYGGNHYASAVYPAGDVPPAGTPLRDGYFTDNQTTTYSVVNADNHPVSSPNAIVSNHSSSHEVTVGDSLMARQRDAIASEESDSPFFLCVDSPIDAAPSIDGVAAARLRRIGISHITHLMNQDSNRLSDTLGLAGVDAKTIRRWQAECRLMCRVQQLRGFDARVLVGCGITDPAQLAAIHPTDLLDRVKTFLATEHGQRILLSGTSYELSRITSWIASANRSIHGRSVRGRSRRSRTVNGRTHGTRVVREPMSDRVIDDTHAVAYEYVDDHDNDHESSRQRIRVVGRDEIDFTDEDFDQERYEVEVVRRADRLVDEIDGLTRDERRRQSQSRRSASSNGTGSSSTSSSRATSRNRSSRRSSDSDRSRESDRSSESDRSGRRRRTSNRSDRNYESSNQRSASNRTRRTDSNGNGQSVRSLYDSASSESGGQRDSDYSRRSNSERSHRSSRDSNRTEATRRDSDRGQRESRSSSYESRSYSSGQSESDSGEKTLRFYLHRADNVVDAPSIGPRMAARLNEIGIITVDDLLQANAANIAEQLNHRRIDEATVLEWQQQTTLVCRVPMMRGHDAQFLVAAGITTAEELAASDPQVLFGEVDAISHSKEGKRIARGGKLPDLEEVTEWITYAGQHRSLQAA